MHGNGRDSEPAGGQRFITSLNPATGEPLARARAASAEEVDACVRRARAAREFWGARLLQDRLAVICGLHAALARDAKRMAAALSAETGRPTQESLGAEVLPALRGLEFLCRRAPGILKPVRTGRGARASAEPYGVIGVIGTWNYPLFLNLIPICHALAAGNTVVWKPSELAIHSARETQRLLDLAGLPPGAVEIVWGDATAGQALTHAECDKYIFTGGVETGRAILAALARTGKPAVMELSGNDAFIVCRDAILERAAAAGVWGRICNAGQSCVAPQRFYVAREIYAPFLQQLRVRIRALRREEMTPLRTGAARDRCHRLVRKAVEHGARLLEGGHCDAEQPGFFYPPTLLADCRDEMPIVGEDLFGPVIAVVPVRDAHEAIARANANPLALSASIWTRDTRAGAALVGALRVGLISVNSIMLDAAEPGIAFGGMRSSGFGKQRGAQGLEAMVVRKTVAVHRPEGDARHLFPYHPAAADILLALCRLRGRRKIRAAFELASAAIDWNKQRAEYTATQAPRSEERTESERIPEGANR